MIEKIISYQSKNVCKYTGVNERELRHWCDKRVIVPTVADAAGIPGHRREYSFEDMVEVAIVKALISGGMRLHRARHILLHYRWHGSDIPHMNFMVVTNNTISYRTDLQHSWSNTDKQMNAAHVVAIISIKNVKSQLKKKVRQDLKSHDE